MLDLHEPDLAFLGNPANRETDSLGYAVASLQWLYWSWSHDDPHVADVGEHFLSAVEVLLRYFHGDPEIPVPEVVELVRQHLSNWRNELDPAVHPLSQLGRVMRGDPGEFLEYPGPIFLLTFHEVLEGIAHEHVAPEWDLNDPTAGPMLLGLSAIVLSEIAVASFWAIQGHGTHLDRELGRLFGPGNRQALVGQLGNLVLAGQAASWGNRVDFIPEGPAQTPEWSLSNAERSVLVECTSFERTAVTVNDKERIKQAIITAWNAKKAKFADQPQPGIITTDISGVHLSREFGTLLRQNLWQSISVPTPSGRPRQIGVYPVRDDWELLQQESQNRDMLGVLASALHCAEARNRNIRGFMAYQGQQVLVDTVNHTYAIPKRGFLMWRGELDEPSSRLLASLVAPAIPNDLVGPPLHIFLV
jgi:hypothetical protein